MVTELVVKFEWFLINIVLYSNFLSSSTPLSKAMENKKRNWEIEMFLLLFWSYLPVVWRSFIWFKKLILHTISIECLHLHRENLWLPWLHPVSLFSLVHKFKINPENFVFLLISRLVSESSRSAEDVRICSGQQLELSACVLESGYISMWSPILRDFSGGPSRERQVSPRWSE